MYWALLLVYLQQYCYCSVFSIALVIRWVIKKQEKYPVAVLAGIVYAAMLGFALFPFKAVQVLVLGSLSTVSNGLTADFASFTVLTFIVTAVCLAIYMLIMKFVIRPDISNFEGVGDMFEDLRHIKMTGEQKIAAFFFMPVYVRNVCTERVAERIFCYQILYSVRDYRLLGVRVSIDGYAENQREGFVQLLRMCKRWHELGYDYHVCSHHACVGSYEQRGCWGN